MTSNFLTLNSESPLSSIAAFSSRNMLARALKQSFSVILELLDAQETGISGVDVTRSAKIFSRSRQRFFSS